LRQVSFLDLSGTEISLSCRPVLDFMAGGTSGSRRSSDIGGNVEPRGSGFAAEQIEDALQQGFSAVLDLVDHVRRFGQCGVCAAPCIDASAVIPGVD